MIRPRQEIRTDHLQTLPAQLIALGILNLEMLHGHNANMAEPAVRKKSRIPKKIINEAEQESDDGLEDDDGLEADVETSF
ncbi:MAG: hypothetical protein WCA38_09830 [Candidatus Acidiferrales bacterium]